MSRDRKITDIQADREKKRNEARRNNGRKKQQKKKLSKALAYIILGLLLISTLVTLSFTVFFKITSVSVIGETIYSESQIIEASGIKNGQNMLALNVASISKNISEKLPYIKSIQIKRKLPSKVEVVTQPNEAVFGIKTESDFILIDENFKVLERSDSCSCITVFGVVPQTAIEGKKLEFNQKIEQIMASILSAISDYEMTDVTKLDLTNEVDIRLLCKEKFVLKLGSNSGLDYKLKFCRKIMDTETEEGVIDVSTLDAKNNKGYYRAKSIKDEISE